VQLRDKQFIVTTRTAFPNFHATIEDQIAEGDLVMTRWSGQGTHQGIHRGFAQGIPPTGKQMTVTGITIERIVDGKAVEGCKPRRDSGNKYVQYCLQEKCRYLQLDSSPGQYTPGGMCIRRCSCEESAVSRGLFSPPCGW